MEENENNPILVSSKTLKSEFSNRQIINITSELFTLGRGLKNSICIPFLAISRNHCTFKKSKKNEWYVEDNSSLGIKINNEKLGQGTKRKLEHEDLISLEPSDEFLYKFMLPSQDVFETPRKRIKVEEEVDSTMINNVRLKFEESQKCEMQHIEEKIQNAKQMQSTSITLKKQLQEDMNRQMQQLEKDFSIQMENLKGEKNEVEKQKALLIVERNAQLSNVKNEMDGKIAELMEQINKHNETESELLNENNILKEKLRKEREDFLSELNRESSSKQDMLATLEAKIYEQEEVRLKERHELEERLRKETELLRLAKEKELKELEELKRQREVELQQELTSIRENFAAQVELTEQQRIKAEHDLRQQMEQMKRQQADEHAKMEQFQKEREEIQKKLTEAQNDAEKSKVESQARVTERETELAALAAERIQKQVDQSSEVISTLQEQLEKVKCQLQTVETEKNSILETIAEDLGEGTSTQTTLNNFGELLESELQCSICAELFVEATTLNCSHTYCKYCIAMWKKNKRDCPICRAPITSECRSLVLDSFIDKMVQNLTLEMKSKRLEILNHRAELQAELAMQPAAGTSRRSSEFHETSEDDEFIEEEEYDQHEDYDQYEDYQDELEGWPWSSNRSGYLQTSEDSGSESAGSEASGGPHEAADPDGRGGATSGDPTSGAAASTGGSSPGDSDAASGPDGGSDDDAAQTDEHSYHDRSDSISPGGDTSPGGHSSPGSDSYRNSPPDSHISDRTGTPDSEGSGRSSPDNDRSSPDGVRSLPDNRSDRRLQSYDRSDRSCTGSDASPHSPGGSSSEGHSPQFDSGWADADLVESTDEHSRQSDASCEEQRDDTWSDGSPWGSISRRGSPTSPGGSVSCEDSPSSPGGSVSRGDFPSSPAHSDASHHTESGASRSGSGSDGDRSDSDVDRTERSDVSDGRSSADSGWADVSESRTGRRHGGAQGRRRERVPGVNGAYFGGYGRCYACGCRGHWAPGCPFR